MCVIVSERGILRERLCTVSYDQLDSARNLIHRPAEYICGEFWHSSTTVHCFICFARVPHKGTLTLINTGFIQTLSQMLSLAHFMRVCIMCSSLPLFFVFFSPCFVDDYSLLVPTKAHILII